MTITKPPIAHSGVCKRPVAQLRLSWRGEPEAWCPGCGRSVPMPDDRDETKEPARD